MYPIVNSLGNFKFCWVGFVNSTFMVHCMSVPLKTMICAYAQKLSINGTESPTDVGRVLVKCETDWKILIKKYFTNILKTIKHAWTHLRTVI